MATVTPNPRIAPSGPEQEPPSPPPGTPNIAQVLESGNNAGEYPILNIGAGSNPEDAARLADIIDSTLVSRYSLGGGEPGAGVKVSLTITNESPFNILDGNTIELPPGKYIIGVSGTVTAPGGNTAQVNLWAEIPGSNQLGGFTMGAGVVVAGTFLSGHVTLPVGGLVYITHAADPAPPTYTNANLYITRVGVV